MATCLSIINRALRKIGRLGAGRDARTNDAQDALDALRGLYSSWVSSGALGRLSDIIVDGDTTTGENQRIVRPIGVTAEITLPENINAVNGFPPPPYGSLWQSPALYEGVNVNVRPPRDGAGIVVIDQATGTNQTWIYDGSIKTWVSIDNLTLNDTAPLSSADPEGLAAVLATEIADQFAADLTLTTVKTADRYRWTLSARMSRPREIAQGVFY